MILPGDQSEWVCVSVGYLGGSGIILGVCG